jgi:putative oxidoreductase
MNTGRLFARAAVGGLFAAHGTQKLFGWFGGPGLEGASEVMESLELRPGRRNALAASLSETVGGTLLILGAFTPVAAAALSGSMFTAIRKVSFSKGFFNAAGGYEFQLTLIAALAALVDGGPGSPSVDSALGIDETGPAWALAAIAAGAAGSTLAVEAGKRLEQEKPSGSGRFAREQAPEAETAGTSS